MNHAIRHLFSGILGLGIVLLLSTIPAYAQRPEITSFEPKQGAYGHTITIKGNGFGTATANVVVMFGAAKATVTSVTDHEILAKVPTGATHDNISVTNLTSGLIGYSRTLFFINFHGNGTGFSLTNLQGQYDSPGGVPSTMEGLFDICMCDFDGDGKNDIGAAKENLSVIEYYRNTSTATGVITFGKNSSSISYALRHVQCGDLNGDGKPDLIGTGAEEGAGKILIFKNTSTSGSISFQNVPVITLAGRTPKRIEIADLDLDGKPEIILTDQTSNPGSVLVLKNQSTTASIAFSATPIVITLPGTISTNALAVKDLDGDGRPDIVASQFNRFSNVFIIKNASSPGTFILNDITQIITTNTFVQNFRIGDVDGDGKPDIAYTQLVDPLANASIASAVGVLLNQSSGSSMSFTNVTYTTMTEFRFSGVQAFGLDLGDMDGDGKLDIVTASFTTKAIAILRNQSSAGSLAFTQHIKTPTNYLNRHVIIGDVDADGKPDIAFTSTDDKDLAIKGSQISVLRNSLCMKPEVTPAGPINICTNNTTDPVKLTATLGGGVTYTWTNSTTSATYPGTNPEGNVLDIISLPSGDYFVTAASADCSPSAVSNTVSFAKSGTGALAAGSTANAGGTVCKGSNIQLSVTNQGAGYTYAWTGPSGFTSTGREPVIPSATGNNGGEYTVSIYAPAGCLAGTLKTTASVIDPPSFIITGGPPFNISCSSFYGTLTASPNLPTDYDYTWYRGTDVVGTGPTISINSFGGAYYYEAKPKLASCDPKKSATYTYTLLNTPNVSFSMKNSACKGEQVEFTNQSTWDSSQTPTFSWNFGNSPAGTSTVESPKYTYPAANPSGTPFVVKLTISYADDVCPTTVTKPITIVDGGAAPSISNPDNKYTLCQDGSLLLQATAGFSSYEWSVPGETTSSITVTEPGTYTLKAANANGCNFTVTRDIDEFDGPVVTVSANPPVIEEGESTSLSANNLLDYSWLPAETVSDPAVAEPTATPLVSTSYTVSGTDQNGCLRTGTVLVEVRGAAIVTKLFPGNFFSPNGDDQNPFWMVGVIDQYPQCQVVIYDDKGVKVFDAKPYLNNWDGTFNGKKLPDGVYYYVIRCDGEESKPRMGSITILR